MDSGSRKISSAGLGLVGAGGWRTRASAATAAATAATTRGSAHEDTGEADSPTAPAHGSAERQSRSRRSGGSRCGPEGRTRKRPQPRRDTSEQQKSEARKPGRRVMALVWLAVPACRVPGVVVVVSCVSRAVSGASLRGPRREANPHRTKAATTQRSARRPGRGLKALARLAAAMVEEAVVRTKVRRGRREPEENAERRRRGRGRRSGAREHRATKRRHARTRAVRAARATTGRGGCEEGAGRGAKSESKAARRSARNMRQGSGGLVRNGCGPGCGGSPARRSRARASSPGRLLVGVAAWRKMVRVVLAGPGVGCAGWGVGGARGGGGEGCASRCGVGGAGCCGVGGACGGGGGGLAAGRRVGKFCWSRGGAVGARRGDHRSAKWRNGGSQQQGRASEEGPPQPVHCTIVVLGFRRPGAEAVRDARALAVETWRRQRRRTAAQCCRLGWCSRASAAARRREMTAFAAEIWALVSARVGRPRCVAVLGGWVSGGSGGKPGERGGGAAPGTRDLSRCLLSSRSGLFAPLLRALCDK